MKTISEKLKHYFDTTSEEQIKKDWEKTKSFDDVISPTINEFLIKHKTMKNTQRTREPP